VATVNGTVLEPAAASWVSRALPQHRITGVETLGGGYRNENIRVVTDRGSYVLRRYRRGGAGKIGRLRALAAAADPLVRAVTDARQLVHSDYNGKNLLAVADGGQWSITAVLDWEFAVSGSPLTGVGNMLRFRDAHPPGFADGFVAGPGRGRAAAAALAGDQRGARPVRALRLPDPPPDHRYFAKAVSALRSLLERDGPA
jgi:Phosphotransferase enzyme family